MNGARSVGIRLGILPFGRQSVFNVYRFLSTQETLHTRSLNPRFLQNGIKGGRNIKFKTCAQCRILTTSVAMRRRDTTKDTELQYGLFGPPIHIHNEHEARVLVHFLKKSERTILMGVLEEYNRKKSTDPSLTDALQMGPKSDNLESITDESESGEVPPVTSQQLRSLFIINSLPFVGFGFLDNVIMIIAGEYIDATLGLALGISTMAAAGIGNLISDVCGVGLAHYVEFIVTKCGVKPPGLTSEQWDTGRVRRTANLGKMIGLVVGCFIGMFPLLFYDSNNKKPSANDSSASTSNEP